MEENDLIWRFIDGDCDEAETIAILKRLEEDPKFKMAVEERKQLDAAFGDLELEQPSMRFTTNVMENLPVLYQQLPTQQLIGPAWVKAFWGGLTFLLVSTLGIGIFMPEAASSSSTAQTGFLLDAARLPELLFIPYKSAIILLAISTSFILLMLLDRQLSKKGKKTVKG